MVTSFCKSYMTRLLLKFICLSVFFQSCKNADPTIKSNSQSNHSFNKFEIGYTDGWGESFLFALDSSKVFFTPGRYDTMYYGILPDSSFIQIKTSLSKILRDTTIKSRKANCFDCPTISMEISNQTDTVRIFQKGHIDTTLYTLIKQVNGCVDKQGHTYFSRFDGFNAVRNAFEEPPKLTIKE
jgi:hypothetical protein